MSPEALGSAVLAATITFDDAVREAWQQRATAPDPSSVFRSHFHQVERRQVPRRDGSPGRFVAQFNPGRFMRRPPAIDLPSVRQRFDPTRFHFGASNFRSDEVLLVLRVGHHVVWVLVNVSPFGHDHFLLVIDPEAGKPQLLDADALRAAESILSLSRRPDLKLGFNSLGACASVNHLHWQGLYWRDSRVPHDLMPSERAHRKAVSGTAGRLHTVDAYPLSGFVLPGSMTDRRTPTLRIIEALIQLDIPHNVLLAQEHTVVFPRRHQSQVAAQAAGLAFLELNGELLVSGSDPVEARRIWSSLDEDAVVSRLEQAALDADAWDRIEEQLGRSSSTGRIRT